MIKFICFGSGSSGNCYYLNCQGHGLLIDVGIGIRTFKKYYKNYGLSFGQLNAILVTHEHTDHVKAVGMVSDEWHLPVLATAGVHVGMQNNLRMTRKVAAERRQIIEYGVTTHIGPFSITSFAVPHDSSSNTGYKIEAEGQTFVLMTDAGSVTEDMRQAVSQADYLVLEANYEPALLDSGPYPLYLRRRIKAATGHMPNDEAGILLAESAESKLKRVWLCHLSEDNNRPTVALNTVTAKYCEVSGRETLPFRLEVLNRRIPTGIFELGE